MSWRRRLKNSKNSLANCRITALAIKLWSLFVEGAKGGAENSLTLKRLTRFIELLVSYTSHFISYYIVLIFIIIIIIVSISISIDRALPMSRPG